MKRLALVVGLALVGYLAFRVQGVAPDSPGVAPLPAPTAGEARQAPPTTVPEVSRDPFQYVDAEAPASRRKPAPVPHSELQSAPPEPRVKLVGFVQDGRGLEAVLAFGAEVDLAQAGERVEGYQVLSVDPSEGVRLLDPDGHEIRLTPP